MNREYNFQFLEEMENIRVVWNHNNPGGIFPILKIFEQTVYCSTLVDTSNCKSVDVSRVFVEAELLTIVYFLLSDSLLFCRHWK